MTHCRRFYLVPCTLYPVTNSLSVRWDYLRSVSVVAARGGAGSDLLRSVLVRSGTFAADTQTHTRTSRYLSFSLFILSCLVLFSKLFLSNHRRFHTYYYYFMKEKDRPTYIYIERDTGTDKTFLLQKGLGEEKKKTFYSKLKSREMNQLIDFT